MTPKHQNSKMAGRERTTSMTTAHGQTFLPAKLPDGIKRMIPIVIKLKKESYRKILQGKIIYFSYFYQLATFTFIY